MAAGRNVTIRASAVDKRSAKISWDRLFNVEWTTPEFSRGGRCRTKRMISALVYCNEIDGSIGHSCIGRGPGPHLLSVLIRAGDNASTTMAPLRAEANQREHEAFLAKREEMQRAG